MGVDQLGLAQRTAAEAIMFENIIVAVDGTSTAQRGLQLAADLAVNQDATLHIVHVVDDAFVVPMETGYMPANYAQTLSRAAREAGRALLASCEAFGRQHGVRLRTTLLSTRNHDISGQLLREATKRKADLIVLGTHGRRGLRRLLLGSDAEMVVREARVPVLLVRGSDAGGGQSVKMARKAGTPVARKATRRKDAPGAQA
jgi:nucleotide-binding universal stress UspA family protein